MYLLFEWISQPWPWYVSGLAICLLMVFMIVQAKTFAFSSNFRTLCAACGAGKFSRFFQYDWKSQSWNLLFLLGSIIGGWIATRFLGGDAPPVLSSDFLLFLQESGFRTPNGPQPLDLYGDEIWSSGFRLMLLITGGFLVGFGARFAGGCTSGHAITGLSNLQWPSLIAVIGFFVGGLLMTHLIFPFLF